MTMEFPNVTEEELASRSKEDLIAMIVGILGAREFRNGDEVVLDGSEGTVVSEQELRLDDRVWVRFHRSGHEMPIRAMDLEPKGARKC